MPYRPRQEVIQSRPQCEPVNTPLTRQSEHAVCSDNDLSSLADILSNSQDYLPRMEPGVFDGDILHFPQWSNSFDTIIEARVKSNT